METQKVCFESSQSINQAFLLPMSQNNHDSFSVGDFLTIGRDHSNSVQINDPFVSSRHVRIEKRHRGYLLRDLQSCNGTFLNGTPVIEAYLSNNDKILVGESVFVFSKINRKLDPLSSLNSDWNKQLKRLPAISNTDYTALIIGPSGAGKELISKWIHKNSPRKKGPFVTLNCSSLSENLIESELFGHVRGAYTGATDDRKGAFEAARGGTLFLDEIGDLPLSLQPKLLRALENNEIRPVGSDQTIKTDVRIIAATHLNLKQKVMNKEFREDLYHRLNICRISPPPLIERMEDFDSLFYGFAKEHRVAFSFTAVEKLKNHLWPGNIRELKNFVIRAAAYFPGKRIQANDIHQLIDKENEITIPQLISGSDKKLPPMKEIERELILKKLQKHYGNQRKSAEELQMPKSTFHDKLKYYKINPKHFKKRGKV